MAQVHWFYSANGGQAGPVSEVELKALAASGQLNPTDLIWRDGLADWMPASKLPGVFDVAAVTPAAIPQLAVHQPAAAPMPSAVLPYVGGGETSGLSPGVTPRSVALLGQTRPWVLLMSILMFIGAGLLGLVGLLAIVFSSLGTRTGSPVGIFGYLGVTLGLFYLAVAAFYFVPALYLFRYAANIARLRSSGRADDLENALESQKSFWKFVGIVSAIVLGIYLVIMAFAMLAAFS